MKLVYAQCERDVSLASPIMTTLQYIRLSDALLCLAAGNAHICWKDVGVLYGVWCCWVGCLVSLDTLWNKFVRRGKR